MRKQKEIVIKNLLLKVKDSTTGKEGWILLDELLDRAFDAYNDCIEEKK